MSGRVLAIGDIHGCDVALDVLLGEVQPVAADTLVVLGDVVDRGPGSRQVIDRLMELQQMCRLIYLMGNHEEMMLDAIDTGDRRDDWLLFGGKETIESYGSGAQDVPPAHLDFLRSGLDYWETDEEIFVHGSLEPDVPLDQQSTDTLHWQRLTGDEPPFFSGKRVICGHTSQQSGLPWVFDGWACIDTCVYGDGYLTCLDVETNLIFQSDQTGAFRGGVKLEELE